MYFPDLTPYQYSPIQAQPQANRVNIGWLDKAHPFATSEPSGELVRALHKLVHHPVRISAPLHLCELCGNAAGTGEIEVNAQDVIYVAPTLIAHYVEQHHYRPPAEFEVAALTQAKALR
ncbi:MAG TPA: hypothetical protein VGK58_03315 [Lacipirellulaceae bacterium]